MLCLKRCGGRYAPTISMKLERKTKIYARKKAERMKKKGKLRLKVRKEIKRETPKKARVIDSMVRRYFHTLCQICTKI